MDINGNETNRGLTNMNNNTYNHKSNRKFDAQCVIIFAIATFLFIVALGMDLHSKSKIIDQYEAKYHKLDLKYSSLKTDYSTLEYEKESVESKLNQINDDYSNLQTEYDNIKYKYDKLKKKNSKPKAVSTKAKTSNGSNNSDSSSDDDNSISSDYLVHITDYGSKYHAAGCRYLKKSDITISKSEAIQRGLSPCSQCNP